MASQEHVTELIPAYALDCLDESDTLQVAEHLANCAVCRTELEAYQGIVDRMALAVPLTEPPVRLKDRLAGRLQTGRLGFRPRWPALTGRATSLWRALSGPATLAVVVLLLASNLLLWRSLRAAGRQTSSGLPAVQLTGVEGASGMLVLSANGEYGTLVVDRLPPLEPDQQYQLWLIENEQRTSGGLLTVGEDGYGALWVSAAQPLANYDAFDITIEPAGGSPGPTGPRVLGGAR